MQTRSAGEAGALVDAPPPATAAVMAAAKAAAAAAAARSVLGHLHSLEDIEEGVALHQGQLPP